LEQPVFVIGCHRSGTNFLYDTLLSAGGFAVYRGYLPIYKMLIPHFGSMERQDSRRKIIATWLQSKGFQRSGLNAEELSAQLDRCHDGGSFIRTVMDSVARKQGAPRWAVYDPDNVLYLPDIKADLPEALFIHIIRDGRDIAVSLEKMGEFRPVPWNRKPASLEATALYWRWMVQSGRKNGSLFPNDYFEVRYEDLVTAPEATLQNIGHFLGQELDYRQIERNRLGSLREPNSSFGRMTASSDSNPVYRWKKMLSREQVATLEALVGDCLQQSGYELTLSEHERRPALREVCMRTVYPRLLDTKLWLKTNTPAGNLSDLSALEIGEESDDSDLAPF